MVNQLQKFKLWVFPSLTSLLGLLILNAANDIRTDMKFLMRQAVSDHVRIDNLERVVYGEASSILQSSPPISSKKFPEPKSEVTAMIPDNRNSTRSLVKKKQL
jgi:hypothetical protein